MNKIKHLARTTAAASALALSVLTASASASAAADGPHAEIGTHCTGWEEVYGSGGYTFTAFRTCVEIDDREGRGAVFIETDKNTYWWGGAWYNTTPVYSADVYVSVDLAASPYQGGPSFKGSGSWTQKSRSAHNSLGAHDLLKCGIRHLDVSYNQVGGYHGSDRAIDVKRSYDDFVIPCSFN